MEKEAPADILITQLCQRMQDTCGREMHTPKDFDFMANRIYEHTHEMVNVSTLKRMYGYVGDKHSPRRTTLDILCRFIGYKDWCAFCGANQDAAASLIVVGNVLYSDELYLGEKLRLLWNPDREIIVRYEGDDVFTVIESNNSKLKIGCTFHCSQFIQDEQLYLTMVTGLTDTTVSYVCGRNGGIRFCESSFYDSF